MKYCHCREQGFEVTDIALLAGPWRPTAWSTVQQATARRPDRVNVIMGRRIEGIFGYVEDDNGPATP
jgi:hypothetical protein